MPLWPRWVNKERNSTWILIMIIFGTLGYIMRKYHYEGAPFLLALILGPMLETSFRQALIIGTPLIFFAKPISACFLGLAFLLLIIRPFIRTARRQVNAN